MRKKERDILELLRENARISVSDMADLTGLSEEAVTDIIQDFESRGVIAQYTVVLDESKIPDTLKKTRALVEIRVRPEKKTGFDAVARRICRYRNVVDHYLLSGQYDFMIVVEGDSFQEIASFVADKIAPIENVVSTVTHFIMKKYKEHGVTLEQGGSNDRLAVSP